MNTSHIQSFLTIVEIGSITEAANELYISQSTLSDRLKTLEKDLGFTLVKRGPGIKNIELTNRGIEFLDYANRYVALNKEIEQWKEHGDIETLRIGAPQSINSLFFRDFYKHIIENQLIHIDVSSHWNRTIYNMVNSSDLDIGIVSRPYKSSNIKTISLFKEKLLVVFDNRFADYGSLDELSVGNQIYIELGPAFDIWYQKYWNLFDIPKITLDSPELIRSYLETENSWAVVPFCLYNDIAEKNDHIEIVETEESPYRELFLIHPVQSEEYQKNYTDEINQLMFDYIKEAEKLGLCISNI